MRDQNTPGIAAGWRRWVGSGAAIFKSLYHPFFYIVILLRDNFTGVAFSGKENPHLSPDAFLVIAGLNQAFHFRCQPLFGGTLWFDTRAFPHDGKTVRCARVPRACYLYGSLGRSSWASFGKENLLHFTICLIKRKLQYPVGKARSSGI